MNSASFRPICIAAVAAIAASVPLAILFVNEALYAALISAPAQLVSLAVIGVVLAVVGARLPFQFNVVRLRVTRQPLKLVVAGVFGALFGLIAGGVGFLAGVHFLGVVAVVSYWLILSRGECIRTGAGS